MKATVIVELKSSVLDPQGKAIQHSLSSLGFGGVEDVRAGKLFRLSLADSGQSREQIESQLQQMTLEHGHRKLLLHPRGVSSPLRSEEHTSELQSLRHLVCR